MAKTRGISKEMRLSQTFSRLSLRQRDLWHGLICTADDQGRLPGLPAAVRSLVWPYDDVKLDEVEEDLNVLSALGNILMYSVGDEMYIQILNWWEYQNMQWAAASMWPAPGGWTDRVRHHGKKRVIITENWDHPGGFKVKENDDDNIKGSKQTLTTKVVDEDLPMFRQLMKTFFEESKLYLDDVNPKNVETVNKWVEMGFTPEDVTAAIVTATEKDLTVVRPASITNIMNNNRAAASRTNTSTVSQLKKAGFDV